MSAVSRHAYLDTRISVLAPRLLDPQTLIGLVDLVTDQQADVLQRAGLAGAVLRDRQLGHGSLGRSGAGARAGPADRQGS